MVFYSSQQIIDIIKYEEYEPNLGFCEELLEEMEYNTR